MATEIVKTIRASGGDYTTLSAWEAALPASLVTVDEQHTAVCYNDWPSGLNDALQITGSATDAWRYIKITVAEGHRHNGVPKSGFFIEGTRAVNGAMLEALPNYTVLEWLDVEHLRNSYNSHGIVVTGSYSTIRNCLAAAVYAGATNSATDISAGSTSNTEATWTIVTNCFAYGSAYYGIVNKGDLSRQRAKYLNCTVVGGHTVGMLSHASVPGRTINCVAYGNTTDFSGTGWHASSVNNASSDSSASVFTGGVTGIVDADFVDATGGDYHLASGSALIGVGSNLYSRFTDDIDGDIRPSSGAWDIGFDHYVATGGPAAELDGDATATATVTGTLTTQIPLSGAAAVITTAAGALSTQIALAGAAATVSSAAGALSASITLSGAALSQALAAAGLTTAIALAGTAAGAAQADGELASGAAQLAGAASAAATGIASLTTQIALSGAALVAALASGDLSATPAGLAGSATAGASAAGALLTQIPLTAAAEASTTAAGGLTTIIQLAAAAASISSATGALLVEFTLSGAALAQALAGGDLTTLIQLDAAAVARAAAFGSLGGGSGVPAILRHLVEAASANWTVEAAPGPWEVYA